MDLKIKALIDSVQARARKLSINSPVHIGEKELIESELFQLAELCERQRTMYEAAVAKCGPDAPRVVEEKFLATKQGRAIVERAMRVDPLRTEMDLAEAGARQTLSAVGATHLSEQHRLKLETARI